MKLTKKRVLEIYHVLEYLKKIETKKPIGFVYNSVRINKTIEPEIEALKTVEPKLQNEYDLKIKDIFLANGKKDDSGKLELKGDTGTLADLVIEDVSKLNKDIAELNNSTNQKDIEDENRAWEDLLNEEIEIDIPKFKFADLFDGIGENEMGILIDIVEE